MGDFEDKLSSLLSSPKDMEKIMDLAKELSGSLGGENQKNHGPSADIFGDFDPKLLSLATKLMGEFRGASNEKQALIAALRPFVKEERREALDRAVTVAKIARVARTALSDPALREVTHAGL